jgi:tape measure domain-containing protein
MANDLVVALRLTGDGKQLRAEIAGTGRSLDELARKARDAGSTTSSANRDALQSMVAFGGGADRASLAMRRLEGVSRLATRALAAVAPAFAAAAIVRAGDEATAALSRLGSTTGNLVTAGEVYDRLYQASLRTGAAVGDSVAAFTRFSVAARDIGATNDQVLRLIEGIQGFGRLAGTSSAEMASATLQLGQALASGTLQGDELRSVLEAMPQLAQALAGQLGMSVGELRKAGAEGRLTADQVFPALLRASEQVQKQLGGLPVTLSQGTGILTSAMDRFLVQIDAAIGASGRLARGLAAAGNALDATRQGLGLRSDGEQADFNRAELARLEAQRAQLAETQRRLAEPGRRGSLRQAQSPEQLLEQARALDEEIARLRIEVDEADRDRTSRSLSERAEAERRAAEGRRSRAAAELATLREETDKEFKLRKEFAERVAVLRRAAAEGVISPEAAATDTARLQRELDESLKKLREGGTGRTTRARDELDIFRGAREAARRLEQEVRTPAEVYGDRLRELGRLSELGGLSQTAYNRALEDAARQFERASKEAGDASTGIEGLDKALEGLNDELKGVGKETADYLAKATLGLDGVRFSFDQLAGKLASGVLSRLIFDQITGPLSRALVQMAQLGLTSIGNLFSGGGYGISAQRGTPVTSAGTGLGTRVVGGLHSGGVAGLEASFLRAVPQELFRGAPRLHSGGIIGPDEVPTILRRGEGVFTQAQMAAMAPAGGGDVTVVVNDYRTNGDAVDVKQGTGPDGKKMIEVTIRDTVNQGLSNGSFDRAMRASYGIARRGG